MSEVNETIGERIQKVRKQRGLTQRELAERSETSELTIRQYEIGKREPRTEQLRKIAVALDISTDYLLGLSQYLNTTNYDVTAEGIGLPEKFLSEYLYLKNKPNWGVKLLNEFLINDNFWESITMLYFASALPEVRFHPYNDPPLYDLKPLEKMVSEATGGECFIANTGYILEGTQHRAQRLFLKAFNGSISSYRQSVQQDPPSVTSTTHPPLCSDTTAPAAPTAPDASDT